MKASKPTSVSALSAGLLLLTLSCGAYAAAEPGEMSDNPGSYTHATETATPAATTVKHRSYGAKIGNKLLRGAANMTTALVELPRNVINATNAGGVGGEGSNIIWGLFGGGAMAVVDFVGRTCSGVVDVVTFPLPTKSIANPEYPWQQFNEDTSFENVFVYDDD